MKKIILALVALLVVGLGAAGAFFYRSAAPSSADHHLLQVASSPQTVASVVVNLRLIKSAQTVASWKARAEPAERFLLKLGGLSPRDREHLLDTFSSFASGFMKTADGPVPFRAFASRVDAAAALERLKTDHLVEAAPGGDYTLIDPETCGREGPFRLIQGDHLLAFVPAELAQSTTALLAAEPGLKLEPLVIAQARVDVRPALESLLPPLVQMIAEKEKLAESDLRLSLVVRADRDGGFWADLDAAGMPPAQLQALWEKATGGDSPLHTVAASSVKAATTPDAFRLTFDLNALQQHAETLTRTLSPFQNEPLTEEALAGITEEELLDPEELFAYGETLTPASFFALSGEECSPSRGAALDDAKKLRLAFTSLSSREHQPDIDFVSLSAGVCVPKHYVPVLAKREWMQVQVQKPAPGRPTCGDLADEPDAMTSSEDFSHESFGDNAVAWSTVGFAFPPGVDTQKLPTVEGTVTLQVPTAVKKVTLALRPPYGRTELVLSGGKLSVEATRAASDGLTFQLGSEGTPPSVLAVRALNAQGKYLETDARSGFSSSITLPLVGRLSSDDPSFFVHGKPTQLEFVLVDATTPYVQPFKLTPPFPTAEAPEEDGDEEDASEPSVAPLSQAVYAQQLQSPEAVARRKERFARYIDGSLLPPKEDSGAPFQVLLQRSGVFANNLEIVWTEDVRQAFLQMNTPVTLELLAVDFADGTSLHPEDMEKVQQSEDGEEYVWGNRYGQKREWTTVLDLARPNISGNIRGVIFSEFLPARLEGVPITRLQGRLSFSLPESVATSALVPLDLRARATLDTARFRIVSLQQGGVSLRSETPGKAGDSALFTDAAGKAVRADLKKRTEFDDGTFQLDFETEGPARQWRMLQARGTGKAYTYPFEIVTAPPRPVSSRRR